MLTIKELKKQMYKFKGVTVLVGNLGTTYSTFEAFKNDCRVDNLVVIRTKVAYGKVTIEAAERMAVGG